MATTDLADLPNGWSRITLGEVATYLNGRAFKSSEWKTDGLPIIRIQNLNDQNASFNYTDQEYENRYRVESGDLLFAWSASLGAYIWRGGSAWLNQHIFRVDPEPFMDRSYLFYFLNNIVSELYLKAHGSGMVHITKKKFFAIDVLLPPLDEQRRIVAKIEQLFSELDNGVDSLKAARAHIKTYRQSLLKAAFEGRLTEQWRRENPDKVETSHQALEYIHKKREAHYQQQLEGWEVDLANWESSGRSGSRPRKPRLHKIVKPERDDARKQFDGWLWVSLAEVSGNIVDGTHKTPTYVACGVPFVSAKDIRDFSVDFSDTRFVSTEEHTALIKRCKPSTGDVLITKSGTIGRVAIVESKQEFSVFESVAVVPVLSGMNSKFVAYAAYFFINNGYAAKSQKGVAVRHLHLEDLRRLPVPVPPADEQERVVRVIDQQISNLCSLEEDIDRELIRSMHLRQSILKRAFEGKLVPQDPDDEPASALLERIRTEQEEAPKPRQRRRKENA